MSHANSIVAIQLAKKHCLLCVWYVSCIVRKIVHVSLLLLIRVYNNRSGGECPTLYTTAKHTALQYDVIHF